MVQISHQGVLKMCKFCYNRERALNNHTYKVVTGAQSVHAVFLQQGLEERPSCARCARTLCQWLVKDVVIHLVGVPAIERWLGSEKAEVYR